MSAKNDITGDLIKSKTNSDAFSNGWELIWGNKNKLNPPTKEIDNDKRNDSGMDTNP